MGKPLFAFSLILALISISACQRESLQSLDKEELFTLTLGKLENQMSVFRHFEVPFKAQSRIYLKDGRVYISDSSSLKIMEFTTYGDLVSLHYNGETNPEPVVLTPDGPESDFSNRSAQRYPFLNLGDIVVDSRKRLYVVDEVPPEQSQPDSELAVVLFERVLLFDRQGRFVDHIGQEGLGGTAFPYIDSIHMTQSDELVVVCKLQLARWMVFWYDTEGYLLYRVEIQPESLPVVPETVPFLESIRPDLRQRALLLMITFYREEIHEVTGSQDAVTNQSSRIYRLDLEKESYQSYLEVPDSGTREEVLGTTKHEISAPSYEWLGNSESGYYYFLLPLAHNQYELLVLSEVGEILMKRVMVIEDSELLFRNLSLSEDGTLIGLLGFEEEIKVVWWRSGGIAEEPT